ncbi:cupin domain-containing protein [Vibrio harveyi]|uniref:cupin domain-containing protein n=1 Tax=Vibrio harveyi TaxID=669 RepID=UPI0038CD3A04
MSVKNIYELAEALTEHWSPQVIASVNDQYIKLAKIENQLVWHTHQEEDEAFFIIKGQMKIEYKDRTVNLKEGDFHVVPKGTPHNPIAVTNSCWLMLIESKSTLHTGEVQMEKTKSLQAQLLSDKVKNDY